MKKLLILLFLSVSAFILSKGQTIEIGGGPGISTGFPFYNLSNSYNRSGNFNITLKGFYKTNKPLGFSPSLTFFIPNVTRQSQTLEERKITINAMMFDFNGHYSFTSFERFDFYGLTGFDILLASKKEVITYDSDPVTHLKTTYTSKVNDNALGFNAGAGASVKITEKIDLYAEARYLLFTKYKLFFSNYNQVVVNAGVLVKLDIQKKAQDKGN
jgi:opacity protein-like surface antigen